MRSNGLRFSAMDLAIAHAEDTLNRVNSYKQGSKETNAELQQRIADMGAAYPTLPKQMVVYSALSGLNPEDELLTVETIQKIEAESHISGLTDKIKEFLKAKGKTVEDNNKGE